MPASLEQGLGAQGMLIPGDAGALSPALSVENLCDENVFMPYYFSKKLEKSNFSGGI